MNPLLLVGISLAGGVGATTRLVVDGLVRARMGTRFPWGTSFINLTGASLLGAATGLAATALLSPAWDLVLGTGLLGGYTTFSTASFETVRLVQERRWAAAFGNGIGVWLLADAVALAGYVLGSHL
ncbi:fluoride efflux transporter FluC [Amnibacterium sp.]|uniref:fluoride efflux transporter FluC n=1 Tax=Amnibacterium sp. TaxID=1872496 RepID=UPI003F7C4DA0